MQGGRKGPGTTGGREQLREAPPRASTCGASCTDQQTQKFASFSLSLTQALRRMALTIAIDVHGAGVALAVVVGVDLGRVVHVRAVVAAVSHLVLVVVELARVEEELAVVLQGQQGRN